MGNIPKAMQQKYDEIATIIKPYCDEYLNEEYKELCLHALEQLSRKQPSPLSAGQPQLWAAGILYAVGQNNWLFDNRNQLHRTEKELVSPLNVTEDAAASRANEIRRTLQIDTGNSEWILPSALDGIPAMWKVMLEGAIVDARTQPLFSQLWMHSRNLIPYVPGLKGEEPAFLRAWIQFWDAADQAAEDEPEEAGAASNLEAFECFRRLIDMHRHKDAGFARTRDDRIHEFGPFMDLFDWLDNCLTQMDINHQYEEMENALYYLQPMFEWSREEADTLRFHRNQVLFMTDRMEESIAFSEEWLREDPESVKARTALVYTYMKKGDLKEAESWLMASIPDLDDCNADNFELYIAAVSLFREMKDRKRRNAAQNALDEFEAVLMEEAAFMMDEEEDELY